MRGFSSARRRRMPSTRSAAALVGGVLLLTAAFAPASLAAAPNPSPGSATVDGATGDWSLGADFFADMTDAGDPERPVRATFYLRYDCDAEVLYGLVLAQNGEKARQDRPDEAYIRIDGAGKLTQPADGNDGTPPDFAWVNGDGTLADGWEASGPLGPGSYTVRAHVLIADDSADGYTPMDIVGQTVPLVIECGGEEPTQGTPTPTPTPTPKPPAGGVAPTQGSRPAATLPPTDTLAEARIVGVGGVGVALVLIGLGTLSGLMLTFSRRRRQPIVEPVEETIER